MWHGIHTQEVCSAVLSTLSAADDSLNSKFGDSNSKLS